MPQIRNNQPAVDNKQQSSILQTFLGIWGSTSSAMRVRGIAETTSFFAAALSKNVLGGGIDIIFS